MRTLRSRLAIMLLLCFVRVLLPDAWVLALHRHTHTTEEPTQATGWPKGKALLSAKHQHCDADQFFKSAFEPAPELPSVAAPAPVFAVTPAGHLPAAWHCQPRPTADLRGPPAAANRA